jgi:ubiquinone/menaquinone biosynthesis C-methylase UbiE
MVDRILMRAAEHDLAIRAQAMDAEALQFDDATFDAALSVLGVILLRNAERGLAEMRRVVHPGGRVSVVTWTQPQNYELAAELRSAILSIRPEQPMAPLPAQLRYREESDFRALFAAAGLGEPAITTATARLEAPSARWLSERIGFAPGMAAMMTGLGHRAPAVIERFIENLEMRLGKGPIGLSGVAFIGTAQVL